MSKITTSLFGELNLISLQAALPAQETISFLTDVQKSVNESENLVCARDVPRRVISYSYPAKDGVSIAAFNMLYSSIRDQIALPIWSDIQKVGEVLNDATSITCDTVYHDLRANSLALLWAFNSIQVVEISTISDTSITVSNSLTYVKNAYLIPIRLAHINGDVSEKYYNNCKMLQITFNIDDEIIYDVPIPTQFLGNDIYFNEYLASNDGSSSNTLSKRDDRFDSGIGEISYLTQVLNSKYLSNYRTVTDNLADNKSAKNIIYRSLGQFRYFWLPTFKQDFRCVDTGFLTNVINIKADDYDQYNDRKNIAIQLSDSSWIPLTILSSSSVIGGNIALTLSDNINAKGSDIRCISYLGLNRFNSDDFSLNWLGNGVLEISNVILEISP